MRSTGPLVWSLTGTAGQGGRQSAMSNSDRTGHSLPRGQFSNSAFCMGLHRHQQGCTTYLNNKIQWFQNCLGPVTFLRWITDLITWLAQRRLPYLIIQEQCESIQEQCTLCATEATCAQTLGFFHQGRTVPNCWNEPKFITSTLSFKLSMWKRYARSHIYFAFRITPYNGQFQWENRGSVHWC